MHNIDHRIYIYIMLYFLVPMLYNVYTCVQAKEILSHKNNKKKKK